MKGLVSLTTAQAENELRQNYETYHDVSKLLYLADEIIDVHSINENAVKEILQRILEPDGINIDLQDNIGYYTADDKRNRVYIHECYNTDADAILFEELDTRLNNYNHEVSELFYRFEYKEFCENVLGKIDKGDYTSIWTYGLKRMYFGAVVEVGDSNYFAYWYGKAANETISEQQKAVMREVNYLEIRGLLYNKLCIIYQNPTICYTENCDLELPISDEDFEYLLEHYESKRELAHAVEDIIWADDEFRNYVKELTEKLSKIRWKDPIVNKAIDEAIIKIWNKKAKEHWEKIKQDAKEHLRENLKRPINHRQKFTYDEIKEKSLNKE